MKTAILTFTIVAAFIITCATAAFNLGTLIGGDLARADSMAKDMTGGANNGQNIESNLQEEDKMITGGSDVFYGWLTLMETALMLVCARWLRT